MQVFQKIYTRKSLAPKQLSLLKKIIKQHIPDKTVWAYGSRVTWKADEASDIDLTVFDCTNVQIDELKETLEESNLLISVDVMNWEEIADNFKTTIKKQYVVLQEKNTLEGWREVKLGEVAELSKVSWKIYDEPFPYIGLEHINENKLRLNSIGDSSSVASNKYRFKTGDILFGKLRPYFRKVLLAKFDGICSTDIWVVKPKGETDNVFLFYFFANTALVDISYSSSSGTRMPRADWTFLSETSWNLPPLPEQKSIAEVLSSLDDKIDLLHRQNKTLENMAQTLFRQWFIEQADAEWESLTLYDAIELVGGGTPKTSVEEYWNGNIKWLSGGDIASNHKSIIISSKKSISVEGLNNSSAKLLPIFSTVISARGTVGKYCMLSEPMAFSQSNYGIKPKFRNCYFFTYLLIDHSVKELNSAAYGSVFDTITTSTFKGMEIKLPYSEDIEIFESQISSYFYKILNNRKQINTLENLRDTLLPKLMSGEVRIKHEQVIQ